MVELLHPALLRRILNTANKPGSQCSNSSVFLSPAKIPNPNMPKIASYFKNLNHRIKGVRRNLRRSSTEEESEAPYFFNIYLILQTPEMIWDVQCIFGFKDTTFLYLRALPCPEACDLTSSSIYWSKREELLRRRVVRFIGNNKKRTNKQKNPTKTKASKIELLDNEMRSWSWFMTA